MVEVEEVGVGLAVVLLPISGSEVVVAVEEATIAVVVAATISLPHLPLNPPITLPPPQTISIPPPLPTPPPPLPSPLVVTLSSLPPLPSRHT